MIKNRKSEIGIERKFRLHMKPFCYRSEQITLLCCNNMLPRNIKFLWIPFADDHRSDKGIIVINTYWKRSCPVGREIKLLIRSEEHTSELQSRENLVCRLLLEKK